MSLLEYHTICVCSDKTNHTNFETYCQNIADLLIGTWLMCLREHSISIVTKIDIRMLIATKNDYKIRYSIKNITKTNSAIFGSTSCG